MDDAATGNAVEYVAEGANQKGEANEGGVGYFCTVLSLMFLAVARLMISD